MLRVADVDGRRLLMRRLVRGEPANAGSVDAHQGGTRPHEDANALDAAPACKTRWRSCCVVAPVEPSAAHRPDTLAERIEAQAECARSLELHVLRPYVEAGVRAEVFATVYDADYCTSEYDGTALWRPYSNSLRAVTIISADAAEQLSATAASLYTFLRHCREHGDRFDAVVMTRYDLRFKSSIASLLGPDLTKFSGIRFLWRELGSSWRNVWSPTPWDVKRADEKQKAAWAKRVGLLKAARDRTFRHFLWRRTHRTPDTFHAFSFEYAQCFEKAIHQEMASFWPPNTSAIVRAEAEARRRGAAGWRASKERLALLQRLKEAARMKPGVPASELNISLSPLFPWIHWMHRMLPQLAEAMGVDAEDDEWRANKTKLSHGLGFLLPEGSWASNLVRWRHMQPQPGVRVDAAQQVDR